MEECKISVWVCREEKQISGLTRRTTCADVVKVLLEDQSLKRGAAASMLSGSALSYCIVEKWRGFERILPNKTKILRLWTAWGDEQENVRFVLVKNEASLASSGPRSAEARVVPSKESQCVCKGEAKCTATSIQEKQRRIVRKAFRKLDKINKKKEETLSKDTSSVEKMETLVHLVISQDHTIRQQIQRIKDLDKEIDRYEAKVHLDRMKRHGINYVQDTYLVEPRPGVNRTGDGGEPCPAEALLRFEEYAGRCEQLVELQEVLAEHEALMESITAEIQEELNKRWMKRRKEEMSGKDQDSCGEEAIMKVTSVSSKTADQEIETENELLLDEDRIKTQLDTCLYIGLRLNADLEAIRSDLDVSQELWEAKEKEFTNLLERVRSMDAGGGKEVGNAGERASAGAQNQQPPSLKPSGWTEETTCGGDGEDSDTGLSSLHSQDSDSAAVCESLV
ncbi:ras association domain-containing protein 10-like [Paramormyrops kingsleyae]|uniref:ras association domain-containing protein 10-like n=1 Tax=Paramormyrops kingsleyae TaxID=1676925 RepID=UPI003B96B1E2